MTAKLGYAVHAGSVSVDRVAQLSERAGGYGAIKVIDDAGYLRNLHPLIDPKTVFVWRSWEKVSWKSDDLARWQNAYPKPVDAALAYLNYNPLQSELNILRWLASQGRTVAIEMFNESGGGVWHFATLAELCRLAAGQGLGVAAINYAVGTMNEAESWHGFDPLGEALETYPNCWCVGHGYWSYSPKWGNPGGSPGEFKQAIDNNYPPEWYEQQPTPYDGTLTGNFLGDNITRAKYHHEQMGFHNIRYAYSEYGADNTGAVPGRQAYDGWLSWVRAGEFQRMRIGNESDLDVMARFMVGFEKQSRLWEWFDWYTVFVMDDNRATRWGQNYRHNEGNLLEQTADRVKALKPPTPQPQFCALTTLEGNVNYRSTPYIEQNVIGFIPPGVEFKVLKFARGYKRSTGEDTWYQIEPEPGVLGWVASWVIQITGQCNDLKEWKEPMPEKTNNLGVWWMSDNSSFGDVQDDLMKYKPLTIRSAHKPHKTAQLLNTFLGYVPRYVIHRFWLQVDLVEVGRVTIDRFDRLYSYVAARTGANAEWKKIEDGIVDTFLEHTDHESLRDLDVYAEGFNPDTADVAYVKAEALRAMALWAGITITKGTPQGNVPKSLGNYKIKACLLNILSTGYTAQTVQMMNDNGLFTAARAYNSIIGVRVPNIPESGSIDELLRVRALIPQDIEVVFVDIGTPNRANLASIMAKVNTRLAAANLTGALFALGVNNQYEIRGLLDTIAAGDDEPPETDPGTPPVEPGKSLILRILETVFNFILGLFRRN